MNWPVVGWPTQAEFRPSAYLNRSPRSDNMRAALGWAGEPQAKTGLRWTARKSLQNFATQIAWSPQLRILALASADSPRICLSGDGLTWQAGTLAITGSNAGVAWSPKLSIFCAATNNASYTSRDGKNWTVGNSPGLQNTGFSPLCWSEELGLFALVGSNLSGNFVSTSPDGITWTLRNVSGLTGTLNSVVWAKEIGLFCASNDSAATFATSSDGITWTARAVPTNSAWYGLAWSPSLRLFCAVAYQGAYGSMTSPDGINWTLGNAATPSGYWTNVTWSEQLRLFCATGTNKLSMTSRDGVSWVGAATPGNSFIASIYVPELMKFVVAAFSGTGDRIMTSP